MTDVKINPKALNLSAIEQSSARVTLGFKCLPKVKLDLAHKAEKIGLTLSEYVENLVMSHERVNEKMELQEKVEKEKLTEKIKAQQTKIDFYENDFLKEIHQQYKDRIVEYKNRNNVVEKIKIVGFQDVYTVIINSFTIKERI